MSPDIVYFFLQHSPGGVISESKTQNCFRQGRVSFQGGWDQIDPSAFFSTFTSPVFWCQAGSFFHKALKLWCTKAAKWNKRQNKTGNEVVSEKMDI